MRPYLPGKVFSIKEIVIWLHENPRAIHEYFQHGSQCNIWLGIMVNILIEFIFYYRLNKNGFLTFLNNKFYDLSKNISLKMIMNFWFQLEMAVLFIIAEILDISLIFIFPEDGSVVLDLRLPRLLDLTPLDFLYCKGIFWGTLKQKVQCLLMILKSLKWRIVQACEEVTDTQCHSTTFSR